MQKLKLIIMVIVLVLCNLVIAYEPLLVNLNSPSITFRDKYVNDFVQGSISLKNDNNFTINISLIPENDLYDNFYVINGLFDYTLEKNKDLEIDYKIKIIKLGSYSENVKIVYSSLFSEPNHFSLFYKFGFVNITTNLNNSVDSTVSGGSRGQGGMSSDSITQNDPKTNLISNIINNIKPKNELINPLDVKDVKTGNENKPQERRYIKISKLDITIIIITLILVLFIFIYEKLRLKKEIEFGNDLLPK